MAPYSNLSLQQQQRLIALNGLVSLAITIVSLTVAVRWLSSSSWLLPSSKEDASAAASRWSLLPASCLLVLIVCVGNYRFVSLVDIGGEGMSTKPSPTIQILNALSHNTLEQCVLAMAAYHGWAATLPLTWQAAIPVASVLFVIGRVLFCLGYRHGAPGRALGFTLTIQPTAALIIITGIEALKGRKGPT